MRAGGFSPGAPVIPPPTTQRFTGFLLWGGISPGTTTARWWFPPVASANPPLVGAAVISQSWPANMNVQLRNGTTYNVTPTGAVAYTIEWFVNETPTGLSLVTGTGVVGPQAFPAPLTLNAGDRLDVRVTAGGGAGQSGPRAQVEVWEIVP